MSSEDIQPIASDETSELDTTPPQPDLPTGSTSSEWKMPEPVFKKTSGYLPKGYVQQLDVPVQTQIVKDGADAENETRNKAIETIESSEINVEPQPDILEEVVEISEPIEHQPTHKKGSIGKLLTILLLLIVFFVLAAMFVAVVWYLLASTPEATIN